MEQGALIQGIVAGDRRSIARAITQVENRLPGYEALLQGLPIRAGVPVIGFTGPPGAGKSTLISGLITFLNSNRNQNGQPAQVAVLAVDPTSPFTHGSLLGDRLRMQEHFNNPQVYIRSLATRGALGGLSAATLLVTDILRSAPFDYIFIETVGVGQSEVEIVSLADTVVVIMVPEAGDEIQTLKSGIMEIGDIFVINKSDREGADRFASGLIRTLHERPAAGTWTIPVIKTIATRQEGMSELMDAVGAHAHHHQPGRKSGLLAEKAYRLISDRRMRDVSVEKLEEELNIAMATPGFNLYRFISGY